MEFATATQVNEQQLKKDLARERLLQVIPYLRNAMEEATAEGKPMLGVLCYNEDGSGRVMSSMEPFEFFEDIALVIDAPEQTEEDTLKAKARSFLSRHGLV